VASTCTYVANKYLRQRHTHSVEQEVEWMYAFDVHINSYLCSFMLTHVLQVIAFEMLCCCNHNMCLMLLQIMTSVFLLYPQYFLLPILLSPSLLSSILANVLYGASIIWYAYITHLGYRGELSGWF
jgi:hypothetical protein